MDGTVGLGSILGLEVSKARHEAVENTDFQLGFGLGCGTADAPLGSGLGPRSGLGLGAGSEPVRKLPALLSTQLTAVGVRVRAHKGHDCPCRARRRLGLEMG